MWGGSTTKILRLVMLGHRAKFNGFSYNHSQLDRGDIAGRKGGMGLIPRNLLLV